MDKKQIQALKNLAPKLSALRKTLRGEERNILDEMVKAYQSEVTTHSSHSANVEKADKASRGASSEVMLHSSGVSKKPAGMRILQADNQNAAASATIELKSTVYTVSVL